MNIVFQSDLLFRWLCACGLLATALAQARIIADDVHPEFTTGQLEFFEKKVRPLLVQHCYSCHSAKAKRLEGSLYLDSRNGVLTGGDSGPAIVPGKPEESLMIEAIGYEELEMPPKGKLAKENIDVFVEWVRQGAPWPRGEKVSARKTAFDWQARKQAHWSWQPIKNHRVPVCSDRQWAFNDIDRFILHRLEQHGLRPAGDADKRTLIRRLYFDLIGLPPTRQQIYDFLHDDSENAYERIVDELLHNKHFGEKWARHWMDLVRYGETLGHEFDYPLHHAYRYRDYLIRAFNQNVPYDQFVKEHLAGDLIQNPRRHPTEDYDESVIGTGFWFLGEAVHAPTDVRADESDRIDNQIDVMCKTFLGLTVGCARCHDHKFDPIPTADYYALAGFLQSSRRQEALLDPHRQIERAAGQLQQLRNKSNVVASNWRKSIPHSLFADLLLAARRACELANGSAKMPGEQAILQAAKEGNVDPAPLRACLKALLSDATKDVHHPMYVWRKLAIENATEAFAATKDRLAHVFQKQQEEFADSLRDTELFIDFKHDSLDGWFVSGEAFDSHAVRSGQWNSMEQRFATPNFLHSGQTSKKLRGVLRSPTFELKHTHIFYRMNAQDVQIRLIVDGFTMDIFNALLFADATLENVKTDGKTTWVRQHRDLSHYVGHRAHIEIIDHRDGSAALEQIRFSNGAVPKAPPNQLAVQLTTDTTIHSMQDLAAAYGEFWLADPKQSVAENVADFRNWWIQNKLVIVPEELQSAAKQSRQIEKGMPHPIHVIALTEGTAEDEHIFIRGNHKNLGDVVPRRIPVAIGGIDQEKIASQSGRLEMAERIVNPENPFVSRVMVNRLWHHLMGKGIVPTVDDFGAMGQEPSHLELLDHLADRFRKDWSIKDMIRQILLSRTYRMSSRSDLDAELIAKVDADNRLLHKARIRRLTAESIRDSLLAVSGRLDPQLFGPSVPMHLTSFMEGRGRPRRNGPLDGNGRRSIYIEIRRNFLSPMMLTFDMPSPFNAMGRRSNSNVPSQSLIMMNDPFVFEQAKSWAERLVEIPTESIRHRIEIAFEQGIGRLPSSSQLAALTAFVKERTSENPAWKDDVKVWTDVCHMIMNMKEFIFLN